MANAQSIQDIAKLMGKVKTDCQSVLQAAQMGKDEVLLGSWYGTAKYQGKQAMNNIRKHYPNMVRVKVVAYGHQLGSDLFAVYGKK